MNKNLIAAAVAGVFAVPGVALAQSSVTISGFLKLSVQNISIKQALPTRTGHTSETRFVDDGPSRITFSMREDLGGGLAAVGQIELRHTIDGNTSFDAGGTGSSAGNMFIGLQSNSWGLLRFGSVDRHYTLSADTAGALTPIFTGSPHIGSGNTSATVMSTVTGGGTRTRNSIGWDSPRWNGFTMSTGWSARQVSGQEGDLLNIPTATISAAGAVTAGPTARVGKGNAWWLTGRYDGSNWFVGASYLNDKQDPSAANNFSQNFPGIQCGGAFSTTAGAAPTACIAQSTTTPYGTLLHSKQWRLAGRYNFSGFGIGLTWDSHKITNRFTGAASGNRHAWQVPFDYTTGPHMFGVQISRASDNKDFAGDQGGSQWSLRYVYSLSKRTSMGVGYASVKNKAAANYNVSGDNTTTANGYSSANAGLGLGEDARVIGMNMRHAF